jgi:hypothetical protein
MLLSPQHLPNREVEAMIFNDNDMTPEEVQEYLESPFCKRVPELDWSAWLIAYELPDARILIDICGEGGNIYSRQQAESFVQAEKERQVKAAIDFENSYPTDERLGIELENLTAEEVLPRGLSMEQGHHAEGAPNYAYPVIDETASSYTYPIIETAIPPEISQAFSKSALTSTLNYFLDLGFCSSYSEKFKFKVFEHILEEIERIGMRDIDSSRLYRHIDLEMLKWDKSRTWLYDVEGDVCIENTVYVGVLNRLSKISKGIFQPQNISEEWDTPKGEIHLKFLLNGKQHEIRPKYMNDWIDAQVIREVNLLLESDRVKFEIVLTGDQTVFVTMLSPSEKKQIETDRKWIFLT